MVVGEIVVEGRAGWGQGLVMAAEEGNGKSGGVPSEPRCGRGVGAGA